MPQQAVPAYDTGANLVQANHVGIAVRDLDRTIAFYEALTGRKPFVQERMSGIEGMYGPKVEDHVDPATGGAQLRYATMQLGNINIDILEFEVPETGTAKAGPFDAGSMHLCFEVEDLQAAFERLQAAGIEFDAPPYTFTPENESPNAVGTQVVYFSDPDGVNLELIQPAGSFVRAS